MRWKCFVMLVLCGFFSSPLLAEAIKLDEASIPKLLAESPQSELSASLAKEAASRFQSESFDNQYHTLGFIEGAYESHSGNWEQVSPTGVAKPAISAAFGLRKKMPYGIQVEGSVSQYKRSTEFPGISTSSFGFIPQLSLKIDLWKNLAGSYDQSQKSRFQSHVDIASLESKLQTHLLVNQARMLFWEIAGVDKRVSIVKKMQEAARTQEKLAKQRQDMSIADSGELALYSSKSAERRAKLLSLEYQRSALVEALSQIIPVLNGKEVLISAGRVDQIGPKVIACSQAIKNYPKAPTKFSPYHKLIKLLEDKLSHERELNQAHLKGELSLSATYSKTGSGEQYSETFKDSWESNRSSRKLLLNFSYPLGNKQAAYDHKQAADNFSFQSQKSQWEQSLNAKHKHMLVSFDYLVQAVQTQKMNTQFLYRSLKSVEKKYAQARLDVYQLIGEQERSLNNDLAMVDTQLQIVKAVLEYLSLFSEFPCEFNQI